MSWQDKLRSIVKTLVEERNLKPRSAKMLVFHEGYHLINNLPGPDLSGALKDLEGIAGEFACPTELVDKIPYSVKLTDGFHTVDENGVIRITY